VTPEEIKALLALPSLLDENEKLRAELEKARACALAWHQRAHDIASTWRETIEEDGVDHDDPDCPQDDTCNCANVAKIFAAFGLDGFDMRKRPTAYEEQPK
jgi:hypothetical protein